MKIVSLLAVSAIAITMTVAQAGTPQEDRQAVMKSVGAATGAGAKMAKGEVEFNAVAAQLALKTMNAAAVGFGYMFPDGTDTGAETEASPAIWSDRAGFDAAVAKFAADTMATPTDLDSFRAAFGAATANCGACHKAYRVKKD